MQHTNPRAPYYAPLPSGTRIRYVNRLGDAKRAHVIAHAPDPARPGSHLYTVEVQGEYGTYRDASVRPDRIARH